jgi:hypothetical protein
MTLSFPLSFNRTLINFHLNICVNFNLFLIVLASSLSPFREGRFIERRLRSSSEGTAGSSRMIWKPKDGNTEEVNSLRKQRAGSSSSKMNSMVSI